MGSRFITLFTGQWADLPLEELCKKAKEFGYDGLELACWGDHLDLLEAAISSEYCAGKLGLLSEHGLCVRAISNHLVGQATLDRIDERHQEILPSCVWKDGDPGGVRERAVEHMKRAARAAQKLGVGVVNGFTGSSIWHLVYDFPPVPRSMIDAGYQLFADVWNPILDVFAKCGVKFALEVHPTEIAFDIVSAQRALEAIGHREEFGFNFDPSHLLWQGVDPVEFIRAFPDRIYHVHMKDVALMANGRSGILSSHLPFGDHRRGWDFRSVGRGHVNFEEIIRALNDINYTGPLSVEWEDSGMEREHGARESCEFVKNLDFSPSTVSFDAAFEKKS